ncbi:MULTISPECIES: error-prone DNA polymerase [Gluconobacter]|uniref:error-prone DNA polymerase n=1 Tax=Gluconobacter TaxID=441 RepID=UPI001B8A8F3C|nr:MULTISPECIES: error-prone DNA polymerase [Gluconobacter]MBS1028618.1 error-prone DNA polymerase [Gluconobacter albidus]MBS1031704.1 error-prone DNA polymerase [Gluconobacter cerinus]MBS1044352.1 error-prone DNA polymerase [Gluconobacter cerinus]MBS1053573.1 error-prone DNA polymerase [Gluconobacter kondonii]MBS1056955.1 error-prone DNA polymerase [Gluconobacter kondonii]
MSAPYVELQVTSSFSFLRSGSQPDELIFQAKALGYDTIGLTDWNTVAGVIRAHLAAREAGLRLLPGCRLALRDGSALLAYPRNRTGWARLCQILTLGHHRGERDVFLLGWEDLVAAAPDLLLILLPPEDLAALPGHVQSLLDLPGHRANEEGTRFLALTMLRQPGDLARLHALAGFCAARGLACVVTGDVLYHDARRHVLQDVVTAIREGCTVDALGNRRNVHADRHLKAPEEQVRLFAAFPDALANTRRIAEICTFSLDDLTYQYPTETERTGESAQETLTRLVEVALPRRYPAGAPPEVEAQIAHELRLIGSLAYAPYFLTVNTIVRHARSLGIVCQGRGSAANSAVCYVLGITSIDPVRSGLLFERFISAERQEPPDIDVDFESDRREEVIQWIYRHYGRHRAALCATVQRYQPKGALREVGKVLGLPEDLTGQLSKHIASSLADPDLCKARAADLGLNLKDRRLSLTFHLARQLLGFPRQLGTHPGGFVLTEDRLDELVPLMPTAMDGRQIIVWDKDDIDVLRFMKVDVLGLGMLGCLRRGFELLHTVYQTRMDLASIPAEDPQTYRMIQKADTLGTFQIESRAQMSMLPRMKPRTFYDLVIQVAIVRPGPIQGDMVHPYLRRREKLEPVTYPSETLRGILGKTLGVPLFQEQAMQVAIHCAGFTPGEADQLRRAMATFKATGGVSPFRDKLVNGMLANGYEQDFAEQTFAQLEGFGSYGFPESHAASFALIAYASAWMKHHYPDVFCAALLNSQPMGFYAPSQIVQDAQRHGVEVRPICINASRWDCTLERSGTSLRKAVRLGFRMVRGLANGHGAALIAARMPDYESIDDVWRRADVPVSALECLAEADAFRVFGQMRRAALWSIKGLADTALPLFEVADRGRNFPLPEVIEPEIVLPQMSERASVHEDYRATGLSLNGHPVAFLREGLRKEGIVRCGDLPYLRDGRRIQLTGLVLMRQRPGTANGTMFVTIEDETGTANLIVWKDVQEKHRLPLLASRLLACKGRLQKEGDVIHVVVLSLEDRTPLLQGSELLKARDFR